MTERTKAVERIARTVNTTTASTVTVEELSDLFEITVRQIDWTRVLLHAAGRHLALHHTSPDVFTGIEGVCGPCVRDALLVTETARTWNHHLISETHDD